MIAGYVKQSLKTCMSNSPYVISFNDSGPKKAKQKAISTAIAASITSVILYVLLFITYILPSDIFCHKRYKKLCL